MARIVADVPVHDVIVGDGEGQVPLKKVRTTLLKLPRVLPGAAGHRGQRPAARHGRPDEQHAAAEGSDAWAWYSRSFAARRKPGLTSPVICMRGRGGRTGGTGTPSQPSTTCMTPSQRPDVFQRRQCPTQSLRCRMRHPTPAKRHRSRLLQKRFEGAPRRGSVFLSRHCPLPPGTSRTPQSSPHRWSQSSGIVLSFVLNHSVMGQASPPGRSGGEPVTSIFVLSKPKNSRCCSRGSPSRRLCAILASA